MPATTVDSEPSTKIPPTLRPARRTSLGHFRLTDSPRTRRAATPATSGIRDIAGCGQSVTNPTDTAIPVEPSSTAPRISPDRGSGGGRRRPPGGQGGPRRERGPGWMAPLRAPPANRVYPHRLLASPTSLKHGNASAHRTTPQAAGREPPRR